MNNTVSSPQRGFTLVELLIVVIILALLAAIVVPQFSSSTDDARETSLDTSLANIRSAIDLYYQQHGSYPSAATAVPAACAGTAGVGLADSLEAFRDQLAFYTNAAGQACSTKSDGVDTNAFPFGPYLKKREIPNNPITDNNGLVIVTAGNLELVPPANTVAGWRFDNVSGKFVADINSATNVDSDGNQWYTH